MTISEYDKRHVGRLLRDESCDWFSAQLLRLIEKADEYNRALLAKVYPEHVKAYLNWDANIDQVED